MRFKKILPYLLFGAMAITPGRIGDFYDIPDSVHAKKTVKLDTKSNAEKLEQKATELCDTYIDFVIQGQKNINNSDLNHRRAVLNELPGAPVGLHCIYGQYTQLNRAIAELGDTINIIPEAGRNACSTFRREMLKKYSAPEYAGAIHQGKMMKPRAYKSALKSFLRRNNVTTATPDSVRQAVIAKFAQNHFSVESLHPGSILIIQKTADPNNTHAVMFLGRGYVRDDNFIPDERGSFIYAGYNNESMRDIFATYNTNRIFAADIHDIALVAYTKEFEKLQQANSEELFRFVYELPSDIYAMVPNRQHIEALAEQKFFDKQMPVAKPIEKEQTNLANINFAPGLSNIIKHKQRRLDK